MLDGLSDAVEVVGDLLDGRSGLNSGNSPSAGPTGAGTGTATPTTYDSGDPGPPETRRERRRRRRRERNERLRERRPDTEQVRDTLNDMHNQTRDDNINEVVDYVQDALDRDGEGPRRRRPIRDYVSERIKLRTRPRFPGNPAEQLLSEEGAAAQEGAARYLHEQENRVDNLATDNFDYDAYLERRQEGPFSGRRESAVDRDGDTAWNRFKDRFWGRSSESSGE